jgi:hypothetical protein
LESLVTNTAYAEKVKHMIVYKNTCGVWAGKISHTVLLTSLWKKQMMVRVANALSMDGHDKNKLFSDKHTYAVALRT